MEMRTAKFPAYNSYPYMQSCTYECVRLCRVKQWADWGPLGVGEPKIFHKKENVVRRGTFVHYLQKCTPAVKDISSGVRRSIWRVPCAVRVTGEPCS